MFRSTKQGESEVNRIIKQENPIFHRVASELLDKFNKGEIEPEADFLAPVRSIVGDFYRRDDRLLPEYFQSTPPEGKFDIGHIK